MLDKINQYFVYLSQEYFVSIIICAIIMGKLCDIFFIPKLKLKDENKKVYLSLIFMGIALLIIDVIVEILFVTPLTWWLGVLALIVGGSLGYIPVSFIKKKS